MSLYGCRMDALIRSVKLDPSRTRLSERRPSPAPDTRAMLRKEIESQLREELRRQVEEQHASARAQGLADGLADARAAAAAEATQHVCTAIAALEKTNEAAFQKLETGIGEIAFAAVCRILGEELATRDSVLKIVKQTCAALRAESTGSVRLHPRDIAVLRDCLHNDELQLPSVALKLIPDESLELGGCVVEAASGHYGGDLEGQLRRLHAILTVARG